MEEEARIILREAVRQKADPDNLAGFIRECLAHLCGVDVELPPREPIRNPPYFTCGLHGHSRNIRSEGRRMSESNKFFLVELDL